MSKPSWLARLRHPRRHPRSLGGILLAGAKVFTFGLACALLLALASFALAWASPTLLASWPSWLLQPAQARPMQVAPILWSLIDYFFLSALLAPAQLPSGIGAFSFFSLTPFAALLATCAYAFVLGGRLSRVNTILKPSSNALHAFFVALTAWALALAFFILSYFTYSPALPTLHPSSVALLLALLPLAAFAILGALYRHLDLTIAITMTVRLRALVRTVTLALLVFDLAGGGAWAANAWLERQSTPAVVAADYISAVGRNDATTIWADSALPASPAPILASEASLAAMLSLDTNQHAPRTAIEATQISVQSATTVTVAVAYQENGSETSGSLDMVLLPSPKLGLYPDWRVVLPLGYLDVSSPRSPASLVLDGLAVPTKAVKVAALVGDHTLASQPAGPFDSASQVVTVLPGATTTPSFPSLFTAAAHDQAAQMLHQAFMACASSTEFAPPQCPQQFVGPSQSTAAWTLVGSPQSIFTTSLGDTVSTVIATGHYQMRLAYPQGDKTVHRLVGGAYAGVFSLGDGTSLSLDGLGIAAAEDQSDPMASSQVLLNAVTKALQGCTAGPSPDCPAYFVSAAHLTASGHWSLVGDPTNGAAITWDGFTGEYNVTGTVTYRAGFGPNRTGHYTAHVFWDGGQASVVWIS